MVIIKSKYSSPKVREPCNYVFFTSKIPLITTVKHHPFAIWQALDVDVQTVLALCNQNFHCNFLFAAVAGGNVYLVPH